MELNKKEILEYQQNRVHTFSLIMQLRWYRKKFKGYKISKMMNGFEVHWPEIQIYLVCYR